ncbi:MAG: extracellular solute-binding protein, partial [Nitrospirales bacterium]
PAPFRAQDAAWIGLSGRLWIIVYNPTMVTSTEITSILDLAEPRWKGKIAIPQAGNEYLQAGVSVILAVQGHARTKAFLQGIKVNAGRRVYAKNSQIVDAVAKGQVALGLVNHYYIYRHLAEDSKASIAPLLPDQAKGGMGTIMNASGVGVVRHTHRLAAAKQLVGFLMSQDGQKMFADLNKEYPLHPQVHPDAALPPRDSFHVAHVPLARLSELREPTTLLIEEVGLR